MPDTFCETCKYFTEVVSDKTIGETSCSECGTVVDDEVLVADQEDPTRVSPVRPESGVSGSNEAPSDEDEQRRKRRRRRRIVVGTGSIADVSDRLGLAAAIKDRANDIYKKVVDQKGLKFKTQDAIVASCIYIACRQENKPRTVKEMCSANGAKKKGVAKATEFIIKYLEAEMGQALGTIHAADFLKRFCSILGMSNTEIMAAQEIVKKSEELVFLRRSPISMAAVVLYIITQLSNDKKTVKGEKVVNLLITLAKSLYSSVLIADIAFLTRAAEVTIRSSYKDLYPHLSEVVPTWFAKEEDLKRLPPA